MMARRVMAGRGGFSPKALFAAGEQGVWYDPSDFSTLFQNAAGTEPVTAVEQPVGLLLDKSKGLVLGPELVDTANTTAAWAVVVGTPTISQDGDAVKIVGAAAGNMAQVALNAVNGVTTNLSTNSFYLVTYEVKVSSGASVSSSFVNATITPTALITTSTAYVRYTQYVLPANIGLALRISQIDAGEEVWVRNISVRELPGNHAFQSTATTSRPVYSRRYNLLTKTEDISVSPWAKLGSATTPSPNSLSLTATGNYIYQPFTGTAAIGNVFVFSAVLSGSGTITLRATIGGATNNRVTLTSTPTRYYLTHTATSADSGPLEVYIGRVDSGDTATSVTVDQVSLVPANQSSLPYQRVNTATDYDADPAKFKPYLKFDGVDDFLVTNSIDFTATDKMTVFAGVRRLTDTAGVISELSSDWNLNAGSLLFWGGADISGTGSGFNSTSRGSATASGYQFGYTPTTFVPPVTAVVSAIHDVAGGLTSVRGNGTAGTNGTGTKGTGNYGNYPLYIGARGGSSQYFDGRLYSLIVRGAQSSANIITATERYVARKTGVTL